MNKNNNYWNLQIPVKNNGTYNIIFYNFKYRDQDHYPVHVPSPKLCKEKKIIIINVFIQLEWVTVTSKMYTSTLLY